MQKDYAIQMGSANLRYGPGSTHEVGMDLSDMGAKKVLIFTDPNISKTAILENVIRSLQRENVGFDVFDKVRIEPTDISLREAIDAATQTDYDAFVAVGGGSTIDTSKAANLYSSFPRDFYYYVNAPIGEGKPVPGPTKPLIAIPTTAGTGSETTGVIIFDITEKHVKTGIAHRYLKPTLGIVDPENTESMPNVIAAASGLDVLCHALESYTALPYFERPLPERPILRPAYQGSNPISDIWSLRAIELVSKYIVRAYKDNTDMEARSNMILAASMAGMGFGNAGVHLCHGMSYPVSGMVKTYKPDGMASDHPIIPHGMSVVLNAPAVFRFTGTACPDRHITAAKIMGAQVEETKDTLEKSGNILADKIIQMMQKLHVPNGLSAIGFTEDDVPALVEGTLPQHRVTKLSPRPADADDLAALFKGAMRYW